MLDRIIPQRLVSKMEMYILYNKGGNPIHSEHNIVPMISTTVILYTFIGNMFYSSGKLECVS